MFLVKMRRCTEEQKVAMRTAQGWCSNKYERYLSSISNTVPNLRHRRELNKSKSHSLFLM